MLVLYNNLFSLCESFNPSNFISPCQFKIMWLNWKWKFLHNDLSWLLFRLPFIFKTHFSFWGACQKSNFHQNEIFLTCAWFLCKKSTRRYLHHVIFVTLPDYLTEHPIQNNIVATSIVCYKGCHSFDIYDICMENWKWC